MHDYTSDEIKRFWSKIAIAESDQCWNWLAGCGKAGYGSLTIRQKRWTSHRFAWTITNGTIPDGLFICHSCDNRKCCNTSHLFLGTAADNVRDAVSKNRNASGEKSSSAILTEQQVREIRKRYAQGGITTYGLGDEYGVSFTTIHAVITRRSWKRVL